MAKRKKKRVVSCNLGEPTKKDFQAVAAILCVHKASADMVGDFAGHFKAQNPNFDRTRFFDAARCSRKKFA